MSSVSLERYLLDHLKYPFEYARVGSLGICENLFLTLKKLCENHIQNVENQRGQDLESLSSDTAASTSATSPWSRFSVRDVENRKRYLTKDLLPWIQVAQRSQSQSQGDGTLYGIVNTAGVLDSVSAKSCCAIKTMTY